MTDPLDQKVEKLYRMMLREQVSEEDYIAQLVKADRQYQPLRAGQQGRGGSGTGAGGIQ